MKQLSYMLHTIFHYAPGESAAYLAAEIMSCLISFLQLILLQSVVISRRSDAFRIFFMLQNGGFFRIQILQFFRFDDLLSIKQHCVEKISKLFLIAPIILYDNIRF